MKKLLPRPTGQVTVLRHATELDLLDIYRLQYLQRQFERVENIERRVSETSFHHAFVAEHIDNGISSIRGVTAYEINEYPYIHTFIVDKEGLFFGAQLLKYGHDALLAKYGKYWFAVAKDNFKVLTPFHRMIHKENMEDHVTLEECDNYYKIGVFK